MVPIKDPQRVIAPIGSAQECMAFTKELLNAISKVDHSANTSSIGEVVQRSTTGPG